jgi:hypothetical protein
MEIKANMAQSTNRVANPLPSATLRAGPSFPFAG